MLEIPFFTHWLWLGLTVIMVIFEIFLGTSFFLLWLGLVSLIVGIVVWIFPLMSWQYQTLIFSVGSIASIILWVQYLKKHPIKTDRPTLNRRSEQYIGKTFTLIEPIVNGRGKIKVGDTTWRVEGPDLPVGTKILVVGANGTYLKVKPTD